MIILLDAGHGESTAGKRSPDGRLREYKYCREIANEVRTQLKEKGFDVELVVTTNEDIPLMQRCRIVNQYCDKHGKTNTVLVSIHCNAAGSGADWLNAKGWSVFISNNSSSKSKTLAECLYKSAQDEGLTLRKYSQTQVYWKQNLAICRETNCPAVLTENLFQDNKEDVAYLLSEKGKKTIIDLHVKGIMDYIKVIQG